LSSGAAAVTGNLTDGLIYEAVSSGAVANATNQIFKWYAVNENWEPGSGFAATEAKLLSTGARYIVDSGARTATLNRIVVVVESANAYGFRASSVRQVVEGSSGAFINDVTLTSGTAVEFEVRLVGGATFQNTLSGSGLTSGIIQLSGLAEADYAFFKVSFTSGATIATITYNGSGLTALPQTPLVAIVKGAYLSTGNITTTTNPLAIFKDE
jgi:hypothetical protein